MLFFIWIQLGSESTTLVVIRYLHCVDQILMAQDEEDPAKRKKRPGLSQGLLPSKKAMKFHNKVYHGTQPK